MSLLASFIAALERTGGERLVLRSGEPPHLMVGDTRRDLGTAAVSNKALTALIAQILSEDAQRSFAETNAAVEPLTGTLSTSSLVVEARRSGGDTSITLRRSPPQPAAAAVQPAPAAAVVAPAPVAAVVAPAPVAAVVAPAPVAAVVAPAPVAAVAKPAPVAAVVAPAPVAAVAKPAPVAAVVAPAPVAAVAKPAPVAAVVAPAPVAAVAKPAPVAAVVAPAPVAAVVAPAPAAAVVQPAPPSVWARLMRSSPPAPPELVVASAEPTKNVPQQPPDWEPIDLAAPEVKVAAAAESASAPAADQPVAIAISEPPPEPSALIADAVPTFIAALKNTGGDRLVFRSGERPHLMVGEIRHDLDTATVSNTALEGFAAQILSADAQRTFAETNSAFEPMSGAASTSPLLVEARRTGNEICIELLRAVEAKSDAPVLTPVGLVSRPVSATPVEPPATSAQPTEHVPEPEEPSEPIGTPAPAMEIATVPEPEPAPAAVPPAAGPIRIVAFPPQEPKATVVGAAQAKTIPALREDIGVFEYWIRQAAGRGATALYLRGGQPPVVRVRERVEQLIGDPVDRSLVEDVTAAFAANDEARQSTSDGEWVREYDGVGEVRCQAFTDDLGPGLVVHLPAQDSASTLQKYIPRQVRRSCEDDDGIVLVSAEAASDVVAMVAAVAQWTAQKRAGYLISVEPPNGLGHDITGTFVSARRIDGSPEDVATAIRRAAQQRPDILVIALPSGTAAEEAIRAARPGCLVILGVVARATPQAFESLLSSVNPHVEPQMRRSLAAGLRCGFSYRELKRRGGGRTVVHDVLIASREVREGLGPWDVGALDTLQRSGVGGMRSLDAALARAVHRREISLRQAATHASDRGELISLVRQASRERVRTSRDRPGVLRAVAGAGTQPL